MSTAGRPNKPFYEQNLSKPTEGKMMIKKSLITEFYHVATIWNTAEYPWFAPT